MDLKTYLKSQFPHDIRKMDFARPNNVMLENAEDFRIDRNTVYFGGEDWESIYADTAGVDKKNLDYFFVCLFTIVTIDLALFTYYRESYKRFREKTMYPKFGWSGFGPHYGNPRGILDIAEKNGLIRKEVAAGFLDEYITLFVDECKNFFTENNLDIDVKEFIVKITGDKQFSTGENEETAVFGLILAKLKLLDLADCKQSDDNLVG